MSFIKCLALLAGIGLSSALATTLTNDIAPRNPDFDLGDEFVRGALADNLKQSLDLIEKAEALPSCGKIATSALLHSCSALEGSIDHENDQLPPGSDLLVEEESDVYATRLAVCELSGAVSVPRDCRPFAPKSKGKTTIKGWLSSSGASKPKVIHDYYDAVTKSSLKQCRKALASSPEAWISYSNSRQNAVAMCHAMQSAVERDESRHVARILTQVAAKTGTSLHDASEQINEQVNQVKQQFHELRTAMPQFQADLAAFDAEIQHKVQQYWSEFDRARGGLESLTSSIDHAQAGMKDARDHLDLVIQKHLPELGKAIAVASRQVTDSSETAVAATDLVAYKVQQIQGDMVKGLENMGYGLASINDMMPYISEVIDSTVDTAMQLQTIIFTHRHEIATAHNETMSEMRTMHETAKDSRVAVEELSRHLLPLIDACKWMRKTFEPYVAPLSFLWDRIVLVSSAVGIGLFTFLYCATWERRGWIYSVFAAIAFMAAFAAFTSFLQTFRLQLAAIWPLSTTTICVMGVMGMVVVGSKCFSRVFRRQQLANNAYDPSSPPYGGQALAIRLYEAVSRPTSLTKSRV